VIPRNYAEGPGFTSLSLRISRNFSLRKAKTAPGQIADGGPGRGGPGMGGGGPMMGGGGPMMMNGGRGGFGGGNGPSIGVTINISNVLNTVNDSAPSGNLSSTRFGVSNSLAGFFGGFGPGGFGGGGGGGEAGNRRIELQIRANF
jgi:translation initiation factor IF-2